VHVDPLKAASSYLFSCNRSRLHRGGTLGFLRCASLLSAVHADPLKATSSYLLICFPAIAHDYTGGRHIPCFAVCYFAQCSACRSTICLHQINCFPAIAHDYTGGEHYLFCGVLLCSVQCIHTDPLPTHSQLFSCNCFSQPHTGGTVDPALLRALLNAMHAGLLQPCVAQRCMQVRVGWPCILMSAIDVRQRAAPPLPCIVQTLVYNL
jgi:hypothetical protein